MKRFVRAALLGTGLLTVLCLFAIAVTAIFGGASSSADTPPTLGTVGERVEAKGVAVTVLGVERKETVVDYQQDDPNAVFVVVEVLVENTDRKEAPYNPMYFDLKIGTGEEFDAGGYGTLKSGTLFRGDRARGTLVFEVSDEATDLVLTYEPLVIAGGYEPIRITLN